MLGAGSCGVLACICFGCQLFYLNLLFRGGALMAAKVFVGFDFDCVCAIAKLHRLYKPSARKPRLTVYRAQTGGL